MGFPTHPLVRNHAVLLKILYIFNAQKYMIKKSLHKQIKNAVGAATGMFTISPANLCNLANCSTEIWMILDKNQHLLSECHPFLKEKNLKKNFQQKKEGRGREGKRYFLSSAKLTDLAYFLSKSMSDASTLQLLKYDSKKFHNQLTSVS